VEAAQAIGKKTNATTSHWPDEAFLMQALAAEASLAARYPHRGNLSNFLTSEQLKQLSDRRYAMKRSMQPPSESSDPLDYSSKSVDRVDLRTPMRRASTFQEGAPSQRVADSNDPTKDDLPVRHTFIHFPGEGDGPQEAQFQCRSAPAIMMAAEFSTMYPTMEAAHIRGDCKPCIYFFKKQDSCRWGGDCEFCHLCPEGSVERKRKQKVQALRLKEFEERMNWCQKRTFFDKNRRGPKITLGTAQGS
jgi:hypothetical protein